MRGHAEKSCHHSFLAKLKMKTVGQCENGSRAKLWNYTFGQNEAIHSKRPQTSLQKIHDYLLHEGYQKTETKTKMWGKTKTETDVFQKDESEVHVRKWIYSGDVRLEQVTHYPHGTKGPLTGQIGINDVIKAMSWGMA